MPARRKKGLHLTLERRGKNKRKLTPAPSIQGEESFHLPTEPLCHSTPSKIRKEDTGVEQEHTTEPERDVVCEHCHVPMISSSTVNSDVYGILCANCGSITKISNSTVSDHSICHHSVLVAYELCEKCGSLNNYTHSHSGILDGQVCEKCGFGISHILEAGVGSASYVQKNSGCDEKISDQTSSGDFVSEEKEENMSGMPNDNSVDTQLLRKCVNVLKDCETGNIIEELIISIANGALKVDSLTYSLIIDTLKALNSTSLTELRYSKLSKLYWKTFMNKFGAAPLRFLSGWKHAGSLLLGTSERGLFTGEEANIIFSIPNESVLKAYDPFNGAWPNSIPPGICTQVVERIAQANTNSSICISFDGKKVSPGLRGDRGDINLLGKEDEVGTLTPEAQKFRYQEEIQNVNSVKELVCSDSLSGDQCLLIIERLRALLTVLTEKKAVTRETLWKKSYALEKLKGQAKGDPTSTKYQYAISLVTANIVKLNELNASGDKIREAVGHICATLTNSQDVWPKLPAVSISDCWRYHSLHDIDMLMTSGIPQLEQFCQYILSLGLPFVKQRSTVWFKARKEVKVTASTLYNAVGCAGLKAQKEHYRQAVLGFEKPPYPSAVQEAMDYGNKHEVCALATIATKVLPSIYPDCCLLEVGAFRISVGTVDIIISPDGYIYCNKSNEQIAAVEVKCPKSGKIPDYIPQRYYLQVQAQIRSKESVQWCLFGVWTEGTTKVFRVERDNEIWSLVEQELNVNYGGIGTRCPSKLSETAKGIKKMIKENIPKHCSTIVELASIHSCLFSGSNDNIVISEEHPEPYTTCITHSSNTVESDPQFIIKSSQSTICNTLEEIVYYLKEHYQLSRKKATEVIAFVASNTDRVWSFDIAYGAPVCYFLKGYSLPNSVMRNILEDVLDYCHSKGLHCPVQSFDGQYVSLMLTSKDGKPQTLLQLQKQFWKEVSSMTKAQLVSDIKCANHVSDISDVISITVQSDGTRVIIVAHRNAICLPQTAFKYLQKETPNAREFSSNSETYMYQRTVQQIMEDLPETVSSLEQETVHNLESTDTENVVITTVGESVHGTDEVNYAEGDGEESSNEDNAVDTAIESDLDPNSCNTRTLNSQDTLNILHILQDESGKWHDKNVEDLQCSLSNCMNLARLTVAELKIVLKYFKDHKHEQVTTSGRKEELINKLKNILNLTGDVPALYSRNRRCSPLTLSVLCQKVLLGKNYPKLALSVAYSNWIFPKRVEKWRNESRIKHGMIIAEVSESTPIDWFYIPEYSATREELFVRKIDPHHLLTRHRSALCKRSIGQGRRSDFLEVAQDNETALKLGMLEDRLDMQSTDFALITFSAEVENELQKKGYTASANMCKQIREWFQSVDDPGISAVQRCRMKMSYRATLLSMVNLSRFPPPGMYVKGYPTALWESTIASIDADIILYGLVRRRTYNQRAVSSQLCESLFSSISTMSSSKNGVPNCCDLETNFAKICGELVVRYDPNRTIHLTTLTDVERQGGNHLDCLVLMNLQRV
ncbi:uncharacterized protein [Ptychodera flava]|uniref:uncharacterized protein isoform X2 n=1 Tax=Ptychodera flava TaxID=63121 RepID=UPI00396A22BC